mmetsp:Transcript_24527/g.76914  ORF Transcript_24527/g.76914 Transcript_24527/m.76914 type:complete len:248 (+) Transcript_24527:208-951(+)
MKIAVVPTLCSKLSTGGGASAAAACFFCLWSGTYATPSALANCRRRSSRSLSPQPRRHSWTRGCLNSCSVSSSSTAVKPTLLGLGSGSPSSASPLPSASPSPSPPPLALALAPSFALFRGGGRWSSFSSASVGRPSHRRPLMSTPSRSSCLSASRFSAPALATACSAALGSTPSKLLPRVRFLSRRMCFCSRKPLATLAARRSCRQASTASRSSGGRERSRRRLRLRACTMAMRYGQGLGLGLRVQG